MIYKVTNYKKETIEVKKQFLKTDYKTTKLATQILPYSSIIKNFKTPKMVIEENINLVAAPMTSNICRTVLLRAQLESRLIIGVSQAVKSLSKSPQDAVFCFLAPPRAGDSATHMHETLLQAFCFENDIYIIKVDSSEKLSRILGSKTLESCALVQRAWATDQTEIFTKSEDTLIDHCEDFWDAPRQPVIRLPEL